MVELTRCYPQHLQLIEPQVAQIDDGKHVSSPEAAAYMCQGVAFTAWEGVTPIGAAGLIEIWPGRCEAWCLLSPRAARYMLYITRRMSRVLRAHPAPRIEMHVAEAFEVGHRWAAMLGFNEENGPGSGLRKAYGRNGENLVEYVRLR